jgi:hypothetical protein
MYVKVMLMMMMEVVEEYVNPWSAGYADENSRFDSILIAKLLEAIQFVL